MVRRAAIIVVVALVGAVALVNAGASDRARRPRRYTGAVAGFYRVPASSLAGRHGTLIRYQRLDDVVAGRLYRVMYTSRSLRGRRIAVTGLVAIPNGGGTRRVVLSWAHATTGIADSCAPSKQSLGVVRPFLESFLERGWIVAATDYEGLGTPGRHPYIVGASEGRGVLDVVRAASELPGANAGRRTLLWGHSQGGQAALFAGELAPRWTPELRVLGTVAGAPPSHLPELFRSLEQGPYRGYVALAAAGINAAYPRARLSQILTAKGRALLRVVDRGCDDDVRRAFAGLSAKAVLRTDPLSVPSWRIALRRVEPGRTIAPSPLLIVHGEADEQIPLDTSRELFDELCAKGQVVERRTYPGQSHAGVIIPSFLPMLSWMDARVAGTPAVSGCKA